jgi:rhodanese-related sulfurtransferase
MVTNISAQEFLSIASSDKRLELLDVRTPAEFGEVHVAFANNIPLDRLDPISIKRLRGDSHEPLYIVCHSGGRSRQACERLDAVGVANVVNVEGGTAACVKAGLPVVRGKKAVSLERQVRIAAGGLVLTGGLIGYFVHPAGFGLCVFVGAGLLFAGLTDTCGMAMVLARMPWNRLSAHR